MTRISVSVLKPSTAGGGATGVVVLLLDKILAKGKRWPGLCLEEALEVVVDVTEECDVVLGCCVQGDDDARIVRPEYLVGAREDEDAIIVISFRNQVGGSKVSLGPTMGSGRKQLGLEEQ